VHLEGEPDSVLAGETGRLVPVRQDDLVPLPGEDRLIFGRPGAGHPVGLPSVRTVARVAGKDVHNIDFEFAGESHRVAEDRVVGPGAFGIRMEWVAVARERAEDEAARADR
jgi:hypothetical protein